jgi:hypothetical protein
MTLVRSVIFVSFCFCSNANVRINVDHGPSTIELAYALNYPQRQDLWKLVRIVGFAKKLYVRSKRIPTTDRHVDSGPELRYEDYSRYWAFQVLRRL